VQVINLLVTPEQAEMLSLAANQTTIQLVLRNKLDTQVAKTSGTALAHLFGQVGRPLPQVSAPVKPRPRPLVHPTTQAPRPPLIAKEPPKPAFVVEMIHGNKKVEQKFQGAPEGK
jgi:pilus assembly protein CpaB